MLDDPRLRRRAVIGGALGAAAVLAGCDPGDDLSTSSSTSASPSGYADYLSSSASPASGDSALVDSVVAQVTQTFGVLVTARRFRVLRAPLASLASTHRAHVAALDAEITGWTAPTVTGPRAALARVRRAETALQQSLATAAAQAESGALARLLASAAASIGQHVASLPAEA